MQKKIKALYGTKIAATDGNVGHIRDFYFDDKFWAIRYVVVDTGNWLTDRLVLLAPQAFGRFEAKAGVLHSHLTKAKIESSPAIETHRPVSRQFEIDYYRYYGWPNYWEGDGMWGMGAYPEMVPSLKSELGRRFEHGKKEDSHLRSAHAVTGYAIQSSDGQIGELSGMMVEDRSWAIPSIVVDAGDWFLKKEVHVATDQIVRISYQESKVFVKLSKEDIRATAENELAEAGTHGAGGFQD